MKLCNCCGETKPLTGFYTRIVAGRRYQRTACKTCHNKRPPYKTAAYYDKLARIAMRKTKWWRQRHIWDQQAVAQRKSPGLGDQSSEVRFLPA